jgi:hypothetical protein
MNSMETTFDEAYRLANLESTIPAITTSIERSFSALKE